MSGKQGGDAQGRVKFLELNSLLPASRGGPCAQTRLATAVAGSLSSFSR